MGAGVNTSQFQIKNYNLNDPPIVLLPARLLWTKGVDDFLEVADKINQERVVARFVLVGKPDLGNKDAVPENVILDWVKDNRLEWWGYSDNIIEVFKKIDIILYPSRYGEGIPKVLIEGASCCKPIVTYNVPGCNQIVLNNVNGYIVGKRNINSLCMKLITLLNNPNLRRQFGNNGRNLVIKDFSSAHINKATLEVWKS
jgi:glycosyltransferase involved in cell wall biosynthesis